MSSDGYVAVITVSCCVAACYGTVRRGAEAADKLDSERVFSSAPLHFSLLITSHKQINAVHKKLRSGPKHNFSPGTANQRNQKNREK